MQVLKQNILLQISEIEECLAARDDNMKKPKQTTNPENIAQLIRARTDDDIMKKRRSKK